MVDLLGTADPVAEGELICSGKGCREAAVWGLLWNNPKIHTPERRKVWLSCADHRDHLVRFLEARSFLRDVVPVDALDRVPEGTARP